MTAPTAPIDPRARVAQLALIRLSLLLGVLLFGGVIYFLHRDPSWRPQPGGNAAAIRMATYVVWAAVVVGALVLRGLHARAPEAERPTFAILGWALGEAAALLGGVYYFLTDDPRRYLIGVFFLLAAFILFPLRRR